MVSIVGELYLDLRTATDQRLVVEVGLARAAVPEASLDAEALLARIERLERRLSIAGGEGVAPTAGPAVSPAAAEPSAKKAELSARRTEPSAKKAAVTGTAARPAGTPARSVGTPAQSAGTPEPQPPVDGAPTGRVARRGKGGERLSTAPSRSTAPSGSTASSAAAEPPVEEAGWGPAEAPARVPVDLDLVRRSWPLVLERVQAASRVTASFLGHGRPVALEGRQLVVELPRDRKFEAEALAGRSRQVDGVLEAVLGGGLEVRVVVGEHTGPEDPDPPPASGPAPAPDQVVEFEVDPANDEGRPLDADADARAVADWAAKALGGKVIEERPNDSGAKGGARGARKGR
jgi:DNA polymerase-3 subunit gamma/tau